jgi:hypothetical protein
MRRCSLDINLQTTLYTTSTSAKRTPQKKPTIEIEQKGLTSNSPKPATNPTRPSPHSGNRLRARRQNNLPSTPTQNLLDNGVCHNFWLDDGHSRAVYCLAVGSDHGCRGPGRVHAGQFDFGRVEAVGFAAEFGGEAFVEGERGGFGHAVGDHASVRKVLVGCAFDVLV